MYREVIRRRIRSFVLREGRLTAGQRRAFEAHWPTYGLSPQAGGTFDLAAAFGRRAPVTLEIGFGAGDSLAALAAAEPQHDFLGIEMHRPGIGRLLHLAAERGLTNLRVIRADAVEVLQQHVADDAFERVLILFPDPWPKRKHHKRRLLTPAFTATLAGRMRPNGLLQLATDWPDYADAMRKTIEGDGRFVATKDDARAVSCFDTRFEQRGSAAGREIARLLYRRAVGA